MPACFGVFHSNFVKINKNKPDFPKLHNIISFVLLICSTYHIAPNFQDECYSSRWTNNYNIYNSK